MIDRGSEVGVTDFVFGMPHRGRLNVLVNVLRKPMQQMLKEFQVPCPPALKLLSSNSTIYIETIASATQDDPMFVVNSGCVDVAGHALQHGEAGEEARRGLVELG